jgi:predicted dehydrogenase
MRVAIIGLGAVTNNIHMPAYDQLRGRVEVVGGCDVDAAARERALRKWRIAQVFVDAREMIEKTKPEIVSICTPPALHYEQVLLALGYGCHVFCEKPVTETLEQVDQLIGAAQRAGRQVVVNNQFPYMKIHQAAKRFIGSEEFGELLYLHAWQTFRPTDATEANWRGQMQRRLCYEFGIHVFELIRFFFDDTPVRVTSHMPRPSRVSRLESINVTTVEFADGRAASIVLDRLSKGPEKYLDMRLDGERAAIYTSIGGEVGVRAGVHTRSRRPFFSLDYVKGGKAVLQTGDSAKLIGKDGINPFASSTAAHFNNFINAIRDGLEPRGTISDNRKTLSLVCAAYDSAESGRTIETCPYLQKPHLARGAVNDCAPASVK